MNSTHRHRGSLPQPVVFYSRALLLVIILVIVATSLIGSGSLYHLLHDLANILWSANGNGSAHL